MLGDFGLIPTLQWFVEKFRARTALQVRLRTPREERRLPPAIEVLLYRVTQEALTNVARHAGATVVEVELGSHDGTAELRVRDDGAGFDPGVIARAGSEGPGVGLGLGGMAERARLVGGELDVRSAPGGGTSVTLRIR
jgi:two-component system sensor histidine kinase UhpB